MKTNTAEARELIARELREKRIAKLNTRVLHDLVDEIDVLMTEHNEPYRTLAECILLSGVGTPAAISKAVCKSIRQAVEFDCEKEKS